ncbi:MAG: hypothetical protein ACOYOB_14045 [Myxococcota bacterium]
MPGIQPTLLKTLAKAAFKTKSIQLPMDWQQPTGDEGKQYVDAFKLSELAVPPDPSKLFVAASPNKYHVDTVKKISNQFEAYIDGICDAICGGIDMWKLQAKFKDIQVMAVSAIGAPGCLDGPSLENLIMLQAPKASPSELKYSQAISKHIAKAWKDWQGQVMVPGLPWYPAFAAFPGPMAPPMPNIPVPLLTCPSAQMAAMTAPQLKQGMVDALGDDKAQHHADLFDSIGQALGTTFLAWLGMQQVMLVMGKGPIPTFAPPYVPVGPVVGGDIISAPGHLMS